MAAKFLVAGGPRVGVLIVSAVATAHALFLVLAPVRAAPLAGYVGASGLTLVPDLAAGSALLVSGLLAVALGRREEGVLAMLASIAWWAPVWVGWEGGWPMARSIGQVVAPLLVPLLLHLVVSATLGNRSPGVRVIVRVAYAVAAVASVGRALFRDPFLDVDCGSNCRDNVFLLSPDRALAGILDAMLEVGALFGAVSLGAYVAVRLIRASWPDRWAHAAVLVPGFFVGVAEAAYAGALLAAPLEGATDPLFVTIFLARAAATAALALGVAWVVIRARMTTAAVARLARDLAASTGPGGLRDALARALGDPGLRIVYWLPRAALYVDDMDTPVDVASLPAGRAATPIVRGSERIAVVIHRAGMYGESLTRDIGAAARLAVENERLQAEVGWQISELRGSRRRIVATADDSRRKLERDLHDGAQQRLLAVSYELRLAQAAAERDGLRDLAAVLQRASDETLTALEELRELAHGIFPAILADAGLAAALATLADRSLLPLELSIALDSRCPAAAEMTAYLVIDDALHSAARRGATGVSVRVARLDGLLQVQVDEDALAPLEDMTHLADRVGALGGRLTDASASRAQTLHAEIPCA